MKKQTIKINESQLQQVIKESINTVLNESFENSEMRELAAKHGGVDKRTTNYLTGGQEFNSVPLDKAKPIKILSRKNIQILMDTIFPDLKLSDDHNALIVFNDGYGAIVEFNCHDKNELDKKLGERNKNYVLNSWNNKEGKCLYKHFNDIPSLDKYYTGSRNVFNNGRRIEHNVQHPKHTYKL